MRLVAPLLLLLASPAHALMMYVDYTTLEGAAGALSFDLSTVADSPECYGLPYNSCTYGGATWTEDADATVWLTIQDKGVTACSGIAIGGCDVFFLNVATSFTNAFGFTSLTRLTLYSHDDVHDFITGPGMMQSFVRLWEDVTYAGHSFGRIYTEIADPLGNLVGSEDIFFPLASLSVTTTAPEPGALSLLGAGLAGLWWRNRRRRKSAARD